MTASAKYADVLFPAVISGDWHVHSRLGKDRLRELTCLCTVIENVKTHVGAESLIVVGDVLDRNSPLSVDTVMELARLFLSFKQVWIVVGNHDTPVRSSRLTSLDLFELCGCRIVKEVTYAGGCLFMPYYTPIPNQYEHDVKYVFAHKDVLNLNNYADTEWAMSMSQFPPCKFIFNGHLHTYQQFSQMQGGTYIQCGAPYPCTWGEKWENNRYVHVLTADGEHLPFYTNITGDKNAAEGTCSIIRERSSVAMTADEVTQQAVMESLQSIKDEQASLEEVLSMASIPDDISPIIRSVVRNAVAKIDAIRF